MSAVAEAHGHDAHGHGAHPPTAHSSSRVHPVLLGIYLFLASEAMLFGSFFAAYYFARVDGEHGNTWPPEGYHLPVYLALLNTIILVTSSFTVHWAMQSIKREHRAGLIAGLGLTILLGLTFLLIQAREYTRLGFAVKDNAFAIDLLRSHRPPRPARVRRPEPAAYAFIRAKRGHFSAAHHHGVEVPGIYWHFVDVMWIIVYVTVYVI